MGRAHEVRAASMAKTAAVKSKLYSIFAKEIYQAAKGNPDPNLNVVLKRVIEKAKRSQVPMDVINRNIDKVKKGITENYETLEYEAFGPGNCTLIIKCLTDNVNRTISEVKTAFNKCGAKLANQGSVSYMYEHLGVVGIKGYTEEAVMNALIEKEVDINDMELDGDTIIIYSEVINLNKVKTALEDSFNDIKFEIDEISYFSKDSIKLNEEDKIKFERLLGMLEEIDDVSNVYYNAE